MEQAQRLIDQYGAVVWEATYRQQIIEGWYCLIFGIALGVVALAFVALVEYMERGHDDARLWHLLQLILTPGAVCLIVYGVMHLSNPIYFAITALLPE